MEFQLIIPCYNEALSLEAMLARSVQAAVAAGFTPERFQLVVVDNGSTDDTKAVLARMHAGAQAAWFRVVSVAANKGYGDGIWQGLQASDAQYVGWTHADEQCDPADAFAALAALKRAPSPASTLAKGVRHSRGLLDYLWSRGFELLIAYHLRVWLFEVNAQPKVFARGLLSHIPSPPVHFAFDLYVLLCAKRAGFSFVTVPVVFGLRAHGQSRWAFSLRNRLKTGQRMAAYVRSLRAEFR